MFSIKRLGVLSTSRSRLGAQVIIAFVAPLTFAASSTAPAGYATLVRQVGPSVVTVLVEEEQISAGQRAAERASADSEYDEVGALIRRLLSGPGGNPGRSDGVSS